MLLSSPFSMFCRMNMSTRRIATLSILQPCQNCWRVQMADGLLMAAARAASKMEAESAAARARTPPNENPRPVNRAVMLAASGAKRGAGAVAYVADKVQLPLGGLAFWQDVMHMRFALASHMVPPGDVSSTVCTGEHRV